jgi:hypothetical protein
VVEEEQVSEEEEEEKPVRSRYSQPSQSSQVMEIDEEEVVPVKANGHAKNTKKVERDDSTTSFKVTPNHVTGNNTL